MIRNVIIDFTHWSGMLPMVISGLPGEIVWWSGGSDEKENSKPSRALGAVNLRIGERKGIQP